MRSGEYSLERKPKPGISFGLAGKMDSQLQEQKLPSPPLLEVSLLLHDKETLKSVKTWAHSARTSCITGGFLSFACGKSSTTLEHIQSHDSSCCTSAIIPFWGITSPFVIIIGYVTHWALVSQLLGILGAEVCLGLEDMDYLVMQYPGHGQGVDFMFFTSLCTNVTEKFTAPSRCSDFPL